MGGVCQIGWPHPHLEHGAACKPWTPAEFYARCHLLGDCRDRGVYVCFYRILPTRLSGGDENPLYPGSGRPKDQIRVSRGPCVSPAFPPKKD